MESSMFDSSMDSVITSPVSQQMVISPTMARFPPIKSAPDASNRQVAAGNVAVVYSSDAKKSFDELFDFEKCKKERPMRLRNFPGTFFDQTSASSSNSQSRDSLDSAHFNSPKRTSVAPDGSSAHLSLKRNQLKAKQVDPLATFESKTRSLPCSFSPSKFDPASLNAKSKVQLESFSQLQRGLQNGTNRLKSTDPSSTHTLTDVPSAVVSVSAVSGETATTTFTDNSARTFFPAMYPTSALHSLRAGQLLPGQVSPSQKVNGPSIGGGPLDQMTATLQYGQPPVSLLSMSLPDQSKEETFLHGLQQLESERAYMRKRQMELLQAKLIGPSMNRSAVVANQQQQSPAGLFAAQPGYELASQQHSLSRQVMMGKPQSRQESIDSGLDLLCCSSSAESTNRVSPELFLQFGNGTLVAASQLVADMQQQQQPYGSEPFGPTVNHKLNLTSPTMTNTATSSGLFVHNAAVGTASTTNLSSRHVDCVVPVTSSDLSLDGNFTRVKLSMVPGHQLNSNVSNSEAGNGNYLCTYSANNNSGSAIDDYLDSMSVCSSPSVHEGILNQENAMEQQQTSQQHQPNGQMLMAGNNSLSLNPMAAGSLFDTDSFISGLLSGAEVDMFDFNGNFSLSGHGVTGTVDSGCDLQAGFSYNL